MLDGVNDSPEQARQLIALVNGQAGAPRVPCKFNLIPFNPFPASGLLRSPRERVLAFAKILQDAGIVTTVRKTRGDDIDAACGQLAGEVQTAPQVHSRLTRPDVRPVIPITAAPRCSHEPRPASVLAAAVARGGRAAVGLCRRPRWHGGRPARAGADGVRPDRPGAPRPGAAGTGHRLLRPRQLETALDETKLAVQVKPDMAEAYNLRALIYAAMGEDRLAEDSFARALQLNPRDGATLHNQAWFLCQRGQYGTAQARFDAVLALPQYRDQARSLLARGVCYGRDGKLAEAEAALMRAYELDPANPNTGLNLADVLYRRQAYERAGFYIGRVNDTPDAVNAQTCGWQPASSASSAVTRPCACSATACAGDSLLLPRPRCSTAAALMTDSSGASRSAPHADAVQAGALLRAARQQQGLHIAALAASIKVTPAKLEALESGRTDELPDLTFTRALAQTVCRVLKIDAAPVLALLPGAPAGSLERVDSGLNTPFRERNGRTDPAAWLPWRHPVLWLAGLLLAAAAAFVLVPSQPAQLPPTDSATAPVMPPSGAGGAAPVSDAPPVVEPASSAVGVFVTPAPCPMRRPVPPVRPQPPPANRSRPMRRRQRRRKPPGAARRAGHLGAGRRWQRPDPDGPAGARGRDGGIDTRAAGSAENRQRAGHRAAVPRPARRPVGRRARQHRQHHLAVTPPPCPIWTP